MRADALVGTQLLVAQSISALADHLEHSTGYQLTPVSFAKLPANPRVGMIACVSDSNSGAWGNNITVGGGSNFVLAFFDGTNWVVH